jgi:hypothetical protein
MHRQIGIRKGVDILRTAAQECRQLANISPQGWRESYLTLAAKYGQLANEAWQKH